MFKVKRIETSFPNGEFKHGQIYNAYQDGKDIYVIDSTGKEHRYGKKKKKISFTLVFARVLEVDENDLLREVLISGTQN